MQQGAFDDTVQRVCALAGMAEPTIVCDEAADPVASTDVRRGVVHLHPDFFDLPDPVQRWMAAHELAHLCCDKPPPRPLAAFAMLFGPFLAGLACWFVAAAAGFGQIGALGVPLTLYVLLQVIQVPRRTAERRADAQAAACGYRLDDQPVKDWALGLTDEPVLRRLLLGDYDPWHRRIARLEATSPRMTTS